MGKRDKIYLVNGEFKLDKIYSNVMGNKNLY